MLEPQERYIPGQSLARARRRDAATSSWITQSNLRLVAKIAMVYRANGLRLRCDLGRPCRPSRRSTRFRATERASASATYAMWWIKACNPEIYPALVSLVKRGTTANQRSFLHFAQCQEQDRCIGRGRSASDQVQAHRQAPGVTEQDVVDIPVASASTCRSRPLLEER